MCYKILFLRGEQQLSRISICAFKKLTSQKNTEWQRKCVATRTVHSGMCGNAYNSQWNVWQRLQFTAECDTLFAPRYHSFFYSHNVVVQFLGPQRPVVTICTTSLTFNNSTFCPHSVFMCFVWISEQTAIISLYNINDWFV